ncbi:MAG TPA: YkoF family thiamine/hydroxymethylpyrimidine-binding protein [Steroidobacteraceae bacterium]
MDIAVELSLYPLEPDRVPKIKDFIDRLNTASGVRVITNSLSTQVVGPFDLVFATLTREIRNTFTQVDKSVVVMKVIGPLTDAGLIR